MKDDVLEKMEILSKLEFKGEEREQIRKDMERILAYADGLKKLVTDETEPMVCVFPIENVMREDVVTNRNDRERLLSGAPDQRDGAILVPRTIEG